LSVSNSQSLISAITGFTEDLFIDLLCNSSFSNSNLFKLDYFYVNKYLSILND